MPTGFYNDQEAVIAAKEAYNMTPKIVKIDNATKEIIKVLKRNCFTVAEAKKVLKHVNYKIEHETYISYYI